MRLRDCTRPLVAVAGALLTLALGLPATAWATTEGLVGPGYTDEQIAASLAAGEVDLSWTGEGDVDVQANGSYALTTIGGSTRYETSVSEALSAFSSADTVVIVGGESYADATSGAGLAGALDAPIILTAPKELPSVVSDAIRTLGAKKVIILGGKDAVSKNVESELKELVGADGVERIAGETRYDTQLAVVQYGIDNGLWTGDSVAVCYGENFADALSFSPVAYALKMPVFFTNAKGQLDKSQLKKLAACEGDAAKTKVYAVGGTTVVSDKAVSALEGVEGVKSVVRLGGATRYDTSYQINAYAVSNLGFTWDHVAFCSGQKPWDALGGGAMQGKNKRLLSLLDNNGALSEPAVYVDGKPAHAVFLGGKDVYPNSFKAQFAYKMGYGIKDIEGFKVYVDAGHGEIHSDGSYTTGASSSDGSYREVDLTRELADKVAAVLNGYGMATYVDKTTTYELRQAQASELDCGLLVAIHFNATDNGTASGAESYIHSSRAPWGSSHLQDCLTQRLADSMGLVNRGENWDQFPICAGKVPSCLLEICFIDNWSDLSTYFSHKDSAARAIADGIMAW